MELSKRKLGIYGAMLFSLPCMIASTVYAAKPIDLRHQPATMLQSLTTSPTSLALQGPIKLEEMNRSTDFNNTTHIRIQQTYAGFTVFGADAVLHIPHAANTIKSVNDALDAVTTNKGFMNGTVYQNLKIDLDKAPADVFSTLKMQKAANAAVISFERKMGGKIAAKEVSSHLIVYIDKDNKAHWAYKVNFYVDAMKKGTAPSKPVYIMDAITLKVYKQWDDIKTLDNSDLKVVTVDGGGFGGNIKMGKLVYDGLDANLAKLNIMRDARKKQCLLKNNDVVVKNHDDNKVMQFACDQVDAEHNQVYWDADFDAVNDGYSPGNDALFGGMVIKDLYKKWYGLEVLTQSNGRPMVLTMIVHERNYDNAYWDGRQMTFGDGETYFYPLTSLGVAAHEISHGFTEQHSNLNYSDQSGGMNESYSDMAAQAAEVFAYGKNSWQIGPEIFKAENEALRYMDQPSKDCKGSQPGNECSIDNMSQYNDDLDVHYSSGIYNRVFYLMGTADGWSTRKAFDVMLKANANYWTSNTTFAQGACGVIQAAKDYTYDTDTVLNAFKTVGVDTSAC